MRERKREREREREIEIYRDRESYRIIISYRQTDRRTK